MFCDIVGSTDLRHRLGDARADTWFAGFLGRIDEAVGDFDGVVVKGLGDGVMAVFTSAGGALDATVAMQQVTHTYGHLADVEPASLRVGVSIGDIATAGDDWNGMPVVMAARLCNAAGPGEILAADIVRVLAGNRCTHPMSPVGEYVLKGIEDPVDVVRVEWAPALRATTTELPSSLDAARRGPFVGRALLIGELYDTWKSKEWRALMVAGEPGIGKTRLVAELANRVHVAGCGVILGRCDPDLAVSYRPWTEALEPLLNLLPAELLAELAPQHIGELCRLVPSLVSRVGLPAQDLVADADTRHAMIVDAVVALLRIVGPVTLVLDDMHWIDQRSLQLARRVLVADLPDVTVIGTYRDTDLDPFHLLTAALADLRRLDGIRRVALDGLDGPAVVEYLEQSAGHELDVDGLTLARAVHTRTSGNPLFVGELLRHLADSGAITFVDERWTGGAEPLELPDGLREVIARRLTSLGAQTNHILQVAAIVGPSFDLGVVEEAVATGTPDRDSDSGGVDVLTHLELARTAGIVADRGSSFEFRHAVIRDVLLVDLAPARRLRLHRNLADTLERRWQLSLDQHLAELAYHHGQARSPQAAAWYLRAAKAEAAALDVGAAALADRGLALIDLVDPPDPALRCDLLITRATGLRLSGAETIDDARLAFDAAVALGDQERIGQALLSVSIRSVAGSQVEHLAFLSEGLRHLSGSTLLSRWNAEVAFLVREFMDPDSNPDTHRTRVEEIVAHLDPGNTLACQIAIRCARSLTSTNQPDDALRITERFVANCDGVDNEGFPVELALSTMWMHLGDRDASDRFLAAAANDPRRSYWFVDCQVLQRNVMRDLLDGKWSAAADGLAELGRVGGNDENFALSNAAQRAWLQRETGEVEASYDMARAYAAALPDFPAVQALLAADTAESGRHDEARSLLDHLAPNDFRAVGRGWLTLLSVGSVAWAAITAGATRHAAVLRRLLAGYGGQVAVIATGTHVMCSVDRLRAGLAAMEGLDGEADRLFAGALAQERALRSRPLEARTLHWWGRAMLDRGETDRGLELLGDARRIAAELSMRAVVHQIDDVLGRDVTPRSGADGTERTATA